MRIAALWGANILGFWFSDRLLDGVVIDGGWGSVVIVALVFGFVGVLLRSLFRLLALPFVVVTFGLALVLVDMVLLWITDGLLESLVIEGFWAFAGCAVVLWLTTIAVRAAFALDRD